METFGNVLGYHKMEHLTYRKNKTKIRTRITGFNIINAFII